MSLLELEQLLYARRDFIKDEFHQLNEEYSALSRKAHEEQLELYRSYQAKPALKDDTQFREAWLDTIGKKNALIRLDQETAKDWDAYKAKLTYDLDIFNQRVRMQPWLTAWNISTTICVRGWCGSDRQRLGFVVVATQNPGKETGPKICRIERPRS